jgi:oligopeptide/dipeptide ABC transporter ATP-binding protein
VTATAASPLLAIDNVHKTFSVRTGSLLNTRAARLQAVSGVSLAVEPGETLGLVGESGCGKSTLGRLIVALERPDSGTIRFKGQDLYRLPANRLRRERRELQLMFQDPYASLDPRMQVVDIVMEPLHVQGIGTSTERRERALALLEEVGLSRTASRRYPHQFSGGQRQRIGLARALALNPTVVVADEPVSALDVSVRAQVLNLMSRLQQKHRLTYIVISHDLSVVRYLSDRIAVMYLGKIVELGASNTIFDTAAHPYTAELLKAVPVPVPSVERTKVGRAVVGEIPSAIDPPSGCRFRTRCPLAQQVCADVEPTLRSMRTGQIAACHFPLQEPAAAVRS